MPKPLIAKHDIILKKFSDSANIVFMNKTKFNVICDNNGFIHPMILLTKILPGTNNGLKYWGFIWTD